jgi:hypothetical protein
VDGSIFKPYVASLYFVG